MMATPAGIMITTHEGTIVSVNPAFTKITGYEAEYAVGKNPRILSSGRHDAEFYRSMWTQIRSTGSWQGEIWNRRKNGQVYPEYLNIAAIRNDDGITTHFVGIFSDIGDIKIADERIIHLAHHDAATGLPNRYLLADRMDRALIRAQRKLSMVAVLFLDLDNFKQINDSWGHAVGDFVLEKIADRLRQNVRSVDTVARIGGDEFVIVLEDVTKDDIAIAKTKQLLDALATPISIGTESIQSSTSIGVAFYPHHGDTAQLLLERADRAMYTAKQTGHNQYHVYR